MRALRTPDVIGEEIEVFRLDLDLAAPVPDADLAILSAAERARVFSLRGSEDRLRAAATRAALRRRVGERLGRDPAALRFEIGPRGKPRLAEDERLEFNVSHSGAVALIALSRHCAVGVDIERMDETIDVAGLGALALTAPERAATRSAAEFLERWVAKEAALKALGLGIGERLQDFSVWPRAGLYELRGADACWSQIVAAPLEAPRGYVAALAWTRREERVASSE